MNAGIEIAIVEDRKRLREGTAAIIRELGHSVILEAENGKDFFDKLDANNLPDIVLMDVQMPVMDGHETTRKIKDLYPDVYVLILTQLEGENAIIRAIDNKADGVIDRGSNTGKEEIQKAINEVYTKGVYYPPDVVKLLRFKEKWQLKQRHIEFLKLICTEETYDKIAEKMHVALPTIDGYRKELFEKYDIKTKAGLVLFAIRNGLGPCT
jgi:two-component system, NarL family, invasion response regulator UvrY